jgi:hypothetical protein
MGEDGHFAPISWGSWSQRRLAMAGYRPMTEEPSTDMMRFFGAPYE